MKAKISKIQLDVDYQCPNCFLHFRLRDKEIPQRKSIRMECPSCWDFIAIPPLSKPKYKKQQKTIDPVIKTAIRAMQSQGYKVSEAKCLVNDAYSKDITLANLIKKAILND